MTSEKVNYYSLSLIYLLKFSSNLEDIEKDFACQSWPQNSTAQYEKLKKHVKREELLLLFK